MFPSLAARHYPDKRDSVFLTTKSSLANLFMHGLRAPGLSEPAAAGRRPLQDTSAIRPVSSAGTTLQQQEQGEPPVANLPRHQQTQPPQDSARGVNEQSSVLEGQGSGHAARGEAGGIGDGVAAAAAASGGPPRPPPPAVQQATKTKKKKKRAPSEYRPHLLVDSMHPPVTPPHGPESLGLFLYRNGHHLDPVPVLVPRADLCGGGSEAIVRTISALGAAAGCGPGEQCRVHLQNGW